MSQQIGSRTFEALRREAKRLLRDHRDGMPSAVSRVSAYWPEAASPDSHLKLAQVQLVIAREHGYRSWRHLKASALTERSIGMNVKAVVEQAGRAGAPGATVHVLTGDESQAEALVAEATERWGAGVVTHLKSADTIPEGPVIVGRWVEYCFAYARQGEAFLGPAAQDRLTEQDRQLADTSALIAEVPEEERRIPCRISTKEKVLASVSFSELTGKYSAIMEISG